MVAGTRGRSTRQDRSRRPNRSTGPDQRTSRLAAGWRRTEKNRTAAHVPGLHGAMARPRDHRADARNAPARLPRRGLPVLRRRLTRHLPRFTARAHSYGTKVSDVAAAVPESRIVAAFVIALGGEMKSTSSSQNGRQESKLLLPKQN